MKKLKQKTILFIVILFTTILLVLSLLIMCSSNTDSIEFQKSTLNKLEFNKLCNDFHSSVELLTTNARLFVVTQNSQYLFDYFDEYETSQKKIEEVETYLSNYSDDIKSFNFSRMKEKLDHIHQIDLYGMKLVISETKNTSLNYPKELTNYKLSLKDQSASKKQRKNIALGLLYSKDYSIDRTSFHHLLSLIENDISNILLNDLLIQKKKMITNKITILLIVLIIYILIIACFLFVYLYSLLPIRTYTHMIQNFSLDHPGDFELSPNGSYETTVLANKFNEISNVLSTVIDDSHDKTEFLSNMSHEIRTSMNTILGISELMNSEDSEAKLKEYTVDINHASHYLLSVINDILDITRIDSGHAKIVERTYSSYDLFSGIVHMSCLSSQKEKIKFIAELSDTIPSICIGDDVRIRQILMNLISNAIKYTKEGYVKFKVECEYSLKNYVNYTFSIEDTGIGIDKKDIPKLFHSYVRLDNSETQRTEGTGLGLFLTKKYVNLMGGNITFTSELSKGSIFVITLTQKVVDSTFMRNIENKLKSYHKEPSFLAPTAKILVVDDHPINIKVASGLLQKYQIVADFATNGEEALFHTEILPYDIIFLDQMMPDLSGIETADLMKEQFSKNKNGKTPIIIALTASVSPESKQDFYSHGFVDILNKPLNQKELEQTLLKHLPKEKIEHTKELHLKTERLKDSLPCIEGIDRNVSLEYCDHNLKIFQSLLHTFQTTGEIKIPIIKNYLSTEEYTKLKIEIHGLKSSSFSIGAINLSNQADILEKILKKEYHSLINNYVVSLLDSYEKLLYNISKYLDSISIETKKIPLEREDFSQRIHALKTLISNYHINQAYEELETINSYEANENINFTKELKVLYNCLNNCNYDTCIKICEEMIHNLEIL
ncbi:MAG: ATP-binding protein [Lachnospiraceae bacterium]|nr:ATP-binding protein [Lachnospiraceae bacterium]